MVSLFIRKYPHVYESIPYQYRSCSSRETATLTSPAICDSDVRKCGHWILQDDNTLRIACCCRDEHLGSVPISSHQGRHREAPGITGIESSCAGATYTISSWRLVVFDKRFFGIKKTGFSKTNHSGNTFHY